MAGGPLIRLDGAERRFQLGPSTIRALDGVTLRIERGEFVAITGPSGSGKSTLLNVLGFLDRLTGGQYTFAGDDVTTASDRVLVEQRRFGVGFIFQQFYLLPRLNARENVEMPLLYQGVTAAERRRRAVAALERVGLGSRVRHRPAELSGGEQQRVAIARALVKDAAFIIADEPTGNLDSRSGAEIIQLLHDLHADGRTILVVTHDDDIARALPRRIRLKDGRLIGEGAA